MSTTSGVAAGGGGGSTESETRGRPPVRKNALGIGKGMLRTDSKMLVNAARLHQQQYFTSRHGGGSKVGMGGEDY